MEGTVAQPATGEKITGHGFYFDTYISVTLYGADETLLTDIWSMCTRYENLFSKTVEGSDIWRINHANGATVTVDPETWNVLKQALEIHELSGGYFSVTIAPVVALWDFTGGTERMPTADELTAALPLVDDSLLVLGDNYTVTLPAGMSIDLGGIAKGFISDRIAELVIPRCMGSMVSLGGNMYVTGHKPDGKQWTIGVQDPDSAAGAMIAVVYVDDGTLVTSGTYMRSFVKDGVLYHHILDPETGMPADTDLVSATIVSHNSMQADALATACILLGSEAALRLMEENGLDAMFIRKDGTILTTEGFNDRYQAVYAR